MEDVDRRRTGQISNLIKYSAETERNVIPIVNTCIEGMLKAADSINADEVSKGHVCESDVIAVVVTAVLRIYSVLKQFVEVFFCLILTVDISCTIMKSMLKDGSVVMATP